MATSVNGHSGKYERAAHGTPRHSALTDGDGAADYALPWSDDDLRGFDYTALDAETRIVVQQRTGEIKSLMRRTAADIIEIGLKLTEVKTRLGHGSFGGWLKAEFEWSERTAQNFMRVADAFKSATVADLIAPKALYLLAAPSTPDAAREEALERAAAGAAVTFSDAKAMTAKHKTALERFPEPLRPAIIQIAEAQAGSLHVPLTPRLVERTGAVITEAATTGCVDTGDGQSTPLAAALTLEQAEALKRQAEYIHTNLERKTGGVPKALHSSDCNEWYTPSAYVNAARELMGAIDLDPASSDKANQTVQAAFYYTLETDGLKQQWKGRVWLNPPYGRGDGDSNQAIWSARLIEVFKAGHVSEAVLLVNAATDRAWFQPLWDYPVCFTNHRIRFYDEYGEPGQQPTHGNALVYLGAQKERFAEIFSHFGTVVTSVRRR